MSTFEVLRYGDADVSSLKTLLALPPAIIVKYWETVHEGEEFETPLPEFNILCRRLSRWAMAAQTHREKQYVRDRFEKALREIEHL